MELSAKDLLDVTNAEPKQIGPEDLLSVPALSANDLLNVPEQRVPSQLEILQSGFSEGVHEEGILNNVAFWAETKNRHRPEEKIVPVRFRRAEKATLFPMSEEQAAINKEINNKTWGDVLGPDADKLNQEQIRKKLHDLNKKKRKELFPDIAGTPFEDTITHKVGEVIGSLLDPTALIAPAITSWKIALGIGASYGLAYEGTRQLAEEDAFDPLQIGVVAAASALITIGTFGIVKGVGNYIGNRKISAVQKALGEADDLVNTVQEGVLNKRASGMPGYESIIKTLEEKGIPLEQYNSAVAFSGRKLLVPESADEASKLLIKLPIDSLSDNWKPGGIIKDMITPWTARVKELEPRVAMGVRHYDSQLKIRGHDLLDPSDAFFNAMDKLPKEMAAEFEKTWVNQGRNILKAAVKNDPEATKAIEHIFKVYDHLHSDYLSVGMKIEKRDSYLNRLVKDKKGLFAALGKKETIFMENLLESYKKEVRRPLTMLEETEIINKALRSRYTGLPTPHGVKERKIETVPDHLLPFYASMKESFHTYVREAVRETETRRFFGQSVVSRDKAGKILDLERTVGNFIAKNKILRDNPQAAHELTMLIKERFQWGSVSPSEAINNIRNWTYSLTLINPNSTVEQIKDVSIAPFRYGIIDSVKSVFGKRYTTSVQEGFREASHELESSPLTSARFLNKGLGLVRFTAQDLWGKTVLINSSLRYYSKLTRTEKGLAEFAKKYGAAFGDDFPKLVNTLRDVPLEKAVKNPLVRDLIYAEIAEVQPTAISEMPLSYIRNPDARIWYTLHSFQLKQMNMLNETILREFKHGSKKVALKNLAKYLIYFNAVGVPVAVLQKWMLGQGADIKVEDIPALAYNNMGKNFMATEYMATKLKNGDIKQLVAEVAVPTFATLATKVGNDLSDIINNDPNFEVSKARTWGIMPFAGKLYDNWAGQASDKYKDKQIKKNREALKVEKDPELDRWAKVRREQRKEMRRELGY